MIVWGWQGGLHHYKISEPFCKKYAGYTRQLNEKNIPVFFEKKNIISADSKGELTLTIIASIAQEESRSTSQNVKMGIAFLFQKRQMQIKHNRCMGYTKDENKKRVIVPEEADIVKLIY